MSVVNGSLWTLFPSVHLRVEEKMSLTCGRDGGLQNMEVLGMITLRVTDEKNGRISILLNNNDKKGAQLQVCETTQHVMVSACILKGKLWTVWDFRKDTMFSLSFPTDLDIQKSFVLTVWLIFFHLSFRLTLMLIKSCSPLSPCLVWKTRISPSLSTVIWGCWNGGYRAQMSPSFL